MKGIITKTVGGFFFIADREKNIHKTSIRGRIEKTVYPGDKVEFSREKNVIEKIYRRENLLQRPRIANVNQVLVVQSTKQPKFNRKLLDRFLIMVEEANLQPLILINKIDLKDKEQLKSIVDEYRQIGYKVLSVSARNKTGLSVLKKHLQAKVNVLTGPSGVGKSSLINNLILGVDLAVKPLSKNIDRGVHTTRHIELLPVGENGWIADTPGFTSLDIDHIESEKLTYFYPEFMKYLDDCKFRGCSHTHEPDCGVKKAVDKGDIAKERYHTYKLFYEEIKDRRNNYG